MPGNGFCHPDQNRCGHDHRAEQRIGLLKRLEEFVTPGVEVPRLRGHGGTEGVGKMLCCEKSAALIRI
ncbi:hypothetical protein DL770_011388 [Monosporascus sp. CRB-9-2]|nr:hypothetical protein DL770_011388 [Monosporascus sp. CRB-9-2]